jgi:hypothetical protein
VSQTSLSNVERFAQLAAAYCVLIERASELPADTILHEAHWRLPELYSAALRLPDVWTLKLDASESEEADDEEAEAEGPAEGVGAYTPDPDTISTEEWMRLWRALGAQLGDRTHYREMFAPYDFEDAEPVVGDLADDLADIYRDLLRGLAKWRRGEAEEAAWVWQFHFAAHWGEHTTSALRALHALAFDHDFGPPPLPSDAQRDAEADE